MKSAIDFQNQPVIELQRGAGRVLIAPQHGARVLRWEHDGREVIHWPEDADWTRLLKVRGGNPILFPFVARHFVDGRQNFWRDTDGTVRPMAQHGFARDAAFVVMDEEADDNSVRMRLTDSDATRSEYPFAFTFDVVVHLHEDGRLEIRFETRNVGARGPCPITPDITFISPFPTTERREWQLDLPCARMGPPGRLGRDRPRKAHRGAVFFGRPEPNRSLSNPANSGKDYPPEPSCRAFH